MEKIKLLPFLFLLYSCENKNTYTSENSYRKEIILKENEVLEDFEVSKMNVYFIVKDTITNKKYVIRESK
ncbi:hypothetical protein CAPN008_21780 [Capnocytophaga canis]|uniref:hypothetical protein n=1 Tax=Capnocytophaga canis TaxID=1848903 RepID=UPI001AC875C0|nr:hypothetical protein [Capnocytophaga canis]GIM62128.1 hypothetical protein CAPN008_21780 [Capnocytophaga canis]